jgi:hypothetical protein
VKRKAKLCGIALILAGTVGVTAGLGMAASQDQQPQSQQSEQQNGQQEQKKKEKKKKGGFFSGLKAVTGQGPEQQELTASAGSKSVGEGAKIANITPTAADRSSVTQMENYSVSPAELKRFEEDGHLTPKQ